MNTQNFVSSVFVFYEKQLVLVLVLGLKTNALFLLFMEHYVKYLTDHSGDHHKKPFFLFSVSITGGTCFFVY